jgi:membrane-associated phospholipid phosphatase
MLYAAAVGTVAGRRLDAQAYRDVSEGPLDAIADVVVGLLNPVTVLLAGAILVVAGMHRGIRTGRAVALLLVGANVSAWVLEHALGELDPLGGEARRALGAAYYPSGHATAAMSLAIGTLVVVPPSARAITAGACAAATLLFGCAVVASGAHTPADVAGAFLLVGAWGTAAAAAPAGRVPLRGQEGAGSRAG